MHRVFAAAVVCLTSTLAFSQEKGKGDAAIGKWRACALETATRFSRTSESAQMVARYAILACDEEKRAVLEALTQEQGAHFADEFVEAVVRRYADRLAIQVIEMRLKILPK